MGRWLCIQQTNHFSCFILKLVVEFRWKEEKGVLLFFLYPKDFLLGIDVKILKKMTKDVEKWLIVLYNNNRSYFKYKPYYYQDFNILIFVGLGDILLSSLPVLITFFYKESIIPLVLGIVGSLFFNSWNFFQKNEFFVEKCWNRRYN